MSVKSVYIQLYSHLESDSCFVGHEKCILDYAGPPTESKLKMQKNTIIFMCWFKNDERENFEPTTIQPYTSCTLDFFLNRYCAILRVVLLMYALINCAARSQYSLPSSKIFGYERSLPIKKMAAGNLIIIFY